MLRWVVCLVVLSWFGTVEASAQSPGRRQYYTAWVRHSSRPYYYRYYYYKPTPSAPRYSYHYGIYYPSRGRRVYMYNPQRKRYWGMWDGEKYALLPPEKQKASINDIALEDFPEPGAAPNIPGSEDNESMLLPPNDFPNLDDTP